MGNVVVYWKNFAPVFFTVADNNLRGLDVWHFHRCLLSGPNHPSSKKNEVRTMEL